LVKAISLDRDHQNNMETPKIRVMVVEDDEAASMFMAEVLEMEGYEVIVVNDSSKAIATANSTFPQCFLLDLMMPPPDGFKLCRILRADPKFRRTPILIVTALDDTDSRIVAIGAGASDYLVKPFAIADLAFKVKHLLGG
jgi:DNA-binding response OmpR family regulator